jgi:MFS family permease
MLIFYAQVSRLLTGPFLLLCVCTSLGSLGLNLLSVAPRWLRAHDLDEAHIGAVMGAFSLASLVAMPFIARLVNRYGRRAIMIAGMAAAAVACAGFEVAGSFAGFAAARVVMGAAWASVNVSASILTTELAPEGRLGQALGASGILILVAIALGPTIGELVAAHASYPWVFRTAAAMCVLGGVLSSALPDRRDDTGAAQAEAGRLGPLLARLRLPLATMLLIAVGFGAIVAFMADFTLVEHIGSMSPFFQSYVAMAILARLTCGTLSDRFGRHPVVIPALAAQAVSLVGLALVGTSWHLIPAGVVFGSSHGLYYPALQALIVERAPADQRARAVASSSFVFATGTALSAFGNGVIARVAGYRTVFVVCGALALVAAGLVAWDRRVDIDANA